ncbi:Creatinase aminopeptidase [Lecanosticta acicola]|uniref:Creatinase aminopeptidase n=1 Tax=Lecanosticta acicola TaxID=111012 RepID=A0AAI8Z525_9PEZI|nr:Creatinase aminopeptidase [Lecanosticta acicola]
MGTEKAALPTWARGREGLRRRDPREWILLITVVVLALHFLSWAYQDQFSIPIGSDRPRKTQSSEASERVLGLPLKAIPLHLEDFQQCSIETLRDDTRLAFLDTAHSLPVNEFVARRDRLAQGLVEDGMDAFAVEPGYTFSYFANVTQPQWEVWEPEERPFLMIVRPQQSHDLVTNELIVRANTTFLVPSFEAERARLLKMPIMGEIELVTYEEHWNPFDTLLSSHVFAAEKRAPKIMVDEEMRDFISRGLAENGFDVHGLSSDVERVRQIKSEAEVGILRAVNTGTVECVRAMRKCMTPGLSEDEVMQVLDNTMRYAGLEPFFDIVLFDDNAANPHGGTDGAKTLEKETMVLIDVGAHLFGYSSDICRSFFPPFFKKPSSDAELTLLSKEVQEKIKVWNIVLEAQTASLHALHENGTCASVDLAARSVISDAGYGSAFTHRVGHGIGIKAHESPYLNKGNTETKLKAGMIFTSEPGIYLVDKFGVRHEDILLVKEEGLPELLTGERAHGPWDP